MNAWPYCEGHPGCHDPCTTQYARVFTGGVPYWIGEGRVGEVMVTVGEQDPKWGMRLCRAHAMIRFRVAYVGNPDRYRTREQP